MGIETERFNAEDLMGDSRNRALTEKLNMTTQTIISPYHPPGTTSKRASKQAENEEARIIERRLEEVSDPVSEEEEGS